MRNPIRAAAQALLVVLLASAGPRTAHAFKDYQVMVYFVNAPWGSDMAALMAAETLFQAVIQWLLTCEILDPGQIPSNRRNLEVAESGDIMPLNEGEEKSASSGGGLQWVSSLRGAAKKEGSEHDGRDLVEISCPNKCSGSGSVKCRSLGCAYCGRCRRDLQATNTTDFTLTSTNALKIEGTLNSNLKIFCLFKSTCKIYAKIYRIMPDGTTIPLTG